MAYETIPNPEKKETVAQLEEIVAKAEGIIFTDFSGLSVAQINDLRSRFFNAGETNLLVAKNTLTKIALSNRGYENLLEQLIPVLKGPTAMALGFNDPVRPVKVIADFQKDLKIEKPAFKGGIVDGEFYGPEDIDKLKDIPPVEQLYAYIVGGISSPLTEFVGVLNETVRSFVGVLDAVIQKKQEEEGTAA